MKKNLLTSLIILAIVFGIGTFIAIKNSNTSNSLSNSNNNTINNQNDKELIDHNELENNEEQVSQDEKIITDEQEAENSSRDKEEDIQPKETTTTNNKEQGTTSSKPVIEDKSVKSLSFSNSYITKELYGNLSYNGGSYGTYSSTSYVTMSLDEVEKMNPLIINPSNAEYNEITYTSSNKNIADFVGNELRIYAYGEITINAIADDGVNGSYHVKFIRGMNVNITAMRKPDYTSTKTPFPYYIGFQFNVSSMSCDKSQQFELDLTLYRDNQKIDNVKISNDYKSNRYVIYTLEDIAGNYYAQYTITDKCNNNTKTGKSKTVYISTDGDQTYVA